MDALAGLPKLAPDLSVRLPGIIEQLRALASHSRHGEGSSPPAAAPAAPAGQGVAEVDLGLEQPCSAVSSLLLPLSNSQTT